MLYFVYVAVCFALFIGGFAFGYFRKTTQLDGDICIAHDKEENYDYAFLRLNGSLDDVKRCEFVQFKVVNKTTRD